MNQGQYQQIFQDADYGFTYDKTEGELAQFLETIHEKLGDANAEEFLGIKVTKTTSGNFATARNKTTFDRGFVIETFTWKKTGDTLKLYGHDIRQIQKDE